MTETYQLPLLYKAHLIETGKNTYDYFYFEDEGKTRNYTPKEMVKLLNTMAWSLTLEPGEVLALKTDKTVRDAVREMSIQEHNRLLKEDVDYKQWVANEFLQ